MLPPVRSEPRCSPEARTQLAAEWRARSFVIPFPIDNGHFRGGLRRGLGLRELPLYHGRARPIRTDG